MRCQTTKGLNMRIVLILLFTMLVFGANAQPTNTPPTNTPPTNAQPKFETQIINRLNKTNSVWMDETKLNEIRRGSISYSGLAVEVARLSNPLQLFNPGAPPKYGSPSDNVLPDPYNGRNLGWKILSIDF
jgi:hypothetical protein